MEINNAHKVLIDKKKRKLYDRFGLKGLQLIEQRPDIAFIISVPTKAISVLLVLTITLLVLLSAFVPVRADFTVQWSWGVTFIPLWILLALSVLPFIIHTCRKSSAVDDSAESDGAPRLEPPGVSVAAFSRSLLFLAFFILLTLRLDGVVAVANVSVAATCSPLMGWLFLELVVIIKDLRMEFTSSESRYRFALLSH